MYAISKRDGLRALRPLCVSENPVSQLFGLFQGLSLPSPMHIAPSSSQITPTSPALPPSLDTLYFL
ncbi:hypothetical protein FA95DRAFT_171510 [Auriscalpium vulgare]|uniref:Uncharacterized protein n=1 Tax=Auriscalpium vulgare TaxID=40419 RepID=A0ACB8RLG8_9AGAM|nr:hypothetical protein FA95DRAFT_171510 [Auriscalpium vulgare]